MKVSIVITTKNAEKYMKDLLDSLIFQAQKPYEIIFVDAESQDKTREIVGDYAKRYDFIKLYVKAGTKAAGRNEGINVANGDIIVFIDADCIANALWIREINNSFEEGADIVAGKTIKFGVGGFSDLPRVAIYHKNVDITYPSCNLAYKKEILEKIGGFDPWFIEAEDVDLNFNAIEHGYKLTYNEDALVYHRARETLFGFIKQSFWYGFSRKQLTLKRGRLWSKYKPIEMVRISRKESIWKLLRLGIAFFGYMFCKLVGRKQELKERMRKSKISGRK
ncbi:MAG: glycosyltransferase [Candidatus Thermoplasmatota archaeon]|nr:glycosyltransferase [Candidatus Thermoplasmatota archaeon]